VTDARAAVLRHYAEAREAWCELQQLHLADGRVFDAVLDGRRAELVGRALDSELRDPEPPARAAAAVAERTA